LSRVKKLNSISIDYSVKLNMANHAQDTQRTLGMLFQAGVGHDVLAEVAKVLESKDKQIKQLDGEIATTLNDIQEKHILENKEDTDDSEDDELVITTRYGNIKDSDITIAQTWGSVREI
jgi:hypothetical protein